jgi:hypothetical protein
LASKEGERTKAVADFEKLMKISKFVSKDKSMSKALEQELFQYILQLDEAEKKICFTDAENLYER